MSCVAQGGTFTWKDEYGFTCPDHAEATWIYPEGFMVSYSTNFGNGSGNVLKIYGDQGIDRPDNLEGPDLLQRRRDQAEQASQGGHARSRRSRRPTTSSTGSSACVPARRPTRRSRPATITACRRSWPCGPSTPAAARSTTPRNAKSAKAEGRPEKKAFEVPFHSFLGRPSLDIQGFGLPCLDNRDAPAV